MHYGVNKIIIGYYYFLGIIRLFIFINALFLWFSFLLGLQIYHLFGLFWLVNFVLALGEVTLAGAFASWYWAFRKPKDVPTFALLESLGRAIL